MKGTEVPSDDVREFIRLGLAALIDAIPVLIRNARLQMGKNDIALAIFVDPDGKRYNSYAKPRLDLFDDLVEGKMSREILQRFEPPLSILEVPVFVSYRDNQFAFYYILQGTAGVLS